MLPGVTSPELSPTHPQSSPHEPGPLAPQTIGVVGSGIMGAGIAVLGFDQLLFGVLEKVLTGIIVAPTGGIIFGFLLTGLIITVFANHRPALTPA